MTLRTTQMVALACCLAASALGQGVLYVNGTTGSDTWDGHCEVWDGGTCGPKATIQAGLDAAAAGDTVLVADGTYAGTGNEYLDFGGKAIRLQSVGGPDNCVISIGSESRGIYFRHNEGPDSIVNGITITASEYGSSCGGVYCSYSSPTLINCRMTGISSTHGGYGLSCWHSNASVIDCEMTSNGASDSSGGGAVLGNYSSPTFTRCTFAGNHGPDIGVLGGGGVVCTAYSHATLNECIIRTNRCQGAACGGVYCDGTSSADLSGCNILQNHAEVGTGSGVWLYNGSATLRNCIVWGNVPAAFGGPGILVVEYSDVQGGWAGAGNIDADPLFVAAASYDYHLTAASPCIDAGDPAFGGAGQTDSYGLARVWDGDADGTARVDMGISEYGSFQYGDLNCDGAPNAFDIDPFVLVLTDPDAYAMMYPDCGAALADANGDGAANAFDIDAFVELLTCGGCPAAP
jgi:hypothetical protein